MAINEEILQDFKSKIVATLGTEGSKKGSKLDELECSFKHDWGQSMFSMASKAGFKTVRDMLRAVDGVIMKNGFFYPKITSDNSHVFDLIDKTLKYKQTELSKPLNCVNRNGIRSYAEQFTRPFNSFKFSRKFRAKKSRKITSACTPKYVDLEFLRSSDLPLTPAQKSARKYVNDETDQTLESYILKTTPTVKGNAPLGRKKVVINWPSAFNFFKNSSNHSASSSLTRIEPEADRKATLKDENTSTWGGPPKFMEKLKEVESKKHEYMAAFKDWATNHQQKSDMLSTPINFKKDYWVWRKATKGAELQKPLEEFANLSSTIKKPLTKLWHNKPAPPPLQDFGESPPKPSPHFNKFGNSQEVATARFREAMQAAKMAQRDSYEFVSKKFAGTPITSKAVNLLTSSMASTNLNGFKRDETRVHEGPARIPRKVLAAKKTAEKSRTNNASSISAKDVQNISKDYAENAQPLKVIKKLPKPEQTVKDLVDILESAGGQLSLEKFKRLFFERYDEMLTGVRLSAILDVPYKNHTVALKAFHPPIFTCEIKNSGEIMVKLQPNALEMLETADDKKLGSFNSVSANGSAKSPGTFPKAVDADLISLEDGSSITAASTPLSAISPNRNALMGQVLSQFITLINSVDFSLDRSPPGNVE